MIIGVDVDGVVADLLTPWLRRYNAAYDDNLTLDRTTTWSLSELVKPECGHRIKAFLTADLYDEVLPIQHALRVIEGLRDEGHRVVFVTACTEGTTDAKLAWLKRHRFLPRGEKSPKDFVSAKDKYLVKLNLLIDDKVENCLGRRSFLFDQPWNVAAMPTLLMQRVYGWPEIFDRVVTPLSHPAISKPQLIVEGQQP